LWLKIVFYYVCIDIVLPDPFAPSKTIELKSSSCNAALYILGGN
jgi:hypothetical protein